MSSDSVTTEGTTHLFVLLNDDIYMIILSYLTINDLLALQLASRQLRLCQLTEMDQLAVWKIHYFTHFLPQFQNVQGRILPSSQLSSGYKKEIIRVFHLLEQKANENQLNLMSKLKKQNIGGFPFVTSDTLLTQRLAQLLEVLQDKKKLKCVFVGDRNVGKTRK